jgi:ubiquinone/menaquinone biosynthesis C-methylase UbiE
MRGIEQIPWLYDACCGLQEAFGLAELRQRLLAEVRGRALEIGCGTGRNLRLPSAARFVVGVDPSAEALQRARRRAPGAALVRASAHDLPFRDHVFDTVVSGLVFCSVPDPERGLGEARRVLAPAGALRMLEHVRAARRWQARLQDWVQPAWTFVSGGCHPNRDTEAAVERAGLHIDAASRYARGNIRCFTARARPEAAA